MPDHHTVHLVRICAWILPLAIYFFFLGMVNSQRRPFLTTGLRDFLALLFGFSGLFLFGPISHLLWGPDLARTVIFAVLTIAFVALIMPRELRSFIAYNLSEDVFRRALEASLTALGVKFESRGLTIYLPEHDMNLTIAAFAPLKNVTLYRQSNNASQRNLWRGIQAALAQQLDKVETEPGLTGRCFILLATTLVCWPLTLMMERANFFTYALEWLRSG